MSDDLIERLRDPNEGPFLHAVAADEIEKLRGDVEFRDGLIDSYVASDQKQNAEIERLRAALAKSKERCPPEMHPAGHCCRLGVDDE